MKLYKQILNDTIIKNIPKDSMLRIFIQDIKPSLKSALMEIAWEAWQVNSTDNEEESLRLFKEWFNKK
jgi:hypothetical protein